jgi:hypothetical protein
MAMEKFFKSKVSDTITTQAPLLVCYFMNIPSIFRIGRQPSNHSKSFDEK